MGMDVYGINPKNKEGEYFRNNVWWWRPLWNYCLETYPKIAGKVEHGHTNDGDGLNSSDSKKLALLIQKDIDLGKVEEYKKNREIYLNSLPLVNCDYCSATGFRNDQFVQGKCNACDGIGKSKHFETHYPFEVDNVQEFQLFLNNCGGFKIC
jgi:hypothetical protein